jgi:hypothetical protein
MIQPIHILTNFIQDLIECQLKTKIKKIVYILDQMDLIFSPFEASMRNIKDNPIEPPALQLSVNLHRFHVNTMQNPGP